MNKTSNLSNAGPTTTTLTSSTTSTSTVATYSIASGTYFYDATGGNHSISRSFGQQATSFAAAISQQNAQQGRPTSANTQVHGTYAALAKFCNKLVLSNSKSIQAALLEMFRHIIEAIFVVFGIFYVTKSIQLS